MMDSWIGLLLWCKKPERRLNKMTAEFCLSGKIRMHGLADIEGYISGIAAKDVKEAVRELRERIELNENMIITKDIIKRINRDQNNQIDKIFGEKLI